MIFYAWNIDWYCKTYIFYWPRVRRNLHFYILKNYQKKCKKNNAVTVILDTFLWHFNVLNNFDQLLKKNISKIWFHHSLRQKNRLLSKNWYYWVQWQPCILDVCLPWLSLNTLAWNICYILQITFKQIILGRNVWYDLEIF